jgi:hypothetical protein
LFYAGIVSVLSCRVAIGGKGIYFKKRSGWAILSLVL